jgi:hypothetical protein
MDSQVDDAVRSVMATGRVRNESRLRAELKKAVADFRSVTSILDTNAAGSLWWPSRLRLDMVVAASGKVNNVLTSVGGSVRIRIEFLRALNPATKPQKPAMVASTDRRSVEARRSLNEFVNIVASELNYISATNKDLQGIKPFVFSVGIGMTAGGAFGVAKTSGQVIGYLCFANGVSQPSRAAKPAPVMLSDEGTVTMIEDTPSQEHLDFANSNRIENDLTISERIHNRIVRAVYKVERKGFRKGLEHAFKMSFFFARHAHRRPTEVGHWGLIELRTGFDMSMGGKLPLVSFTGLATTQVAMYNEEF